mgnify:CR=1 FL=1
MPAGTSICLFHDGTSLDDIDQGIFGTCYFLATLSGLATLPNVMKQVGDHACGRYSVITKTVNIQYLYITLKCCDQTCFLKVR